MLIFLILIYILGVVATLLLFYRSLNSEDKVTLGDLTIAMIMGMFSWYAFIIFILIICGDEVIKLRDKTIFRKK